jgi:hypothetical protein
MLEESLWRQGVDLAILQEVTNENLDMIRRNIAYVNEGTDTWYRNIRRVRPNVLKHSAHSIGKRNLSDVPRHMNEKYIRPASSGEEARVGSLLQDRYRTFDISRR